MYFVGSCFSGKHFSSIDNTGNLSAFFSSNQHNNHVIEIFIQGASGNNVFEIIEKYNTIVIIRL